MSYSDLRMKFISFVLRKYRHFTKKNSNNLSFEHQNFKRIMIISNKLLGDFLFCTPAIRALKEKYPHAEILAVISHKNKGIIGENNFINKVVYMDSTLTDVLKALPEIRKFKPEISVIFHSRTPYDLILSVFSRSNFIIKHYFNNDIKKLFNVCDHFVLDPCTPPVLNHLALISKLGCDIQGKKMFFPAEVPKIMKDSTSPLIIGYQLGASKPNRYLPETTLQQLTEMLSLHSPLCEFHLFGAPSEKPLGDTFVKGLTEETSHKVVNHIGKTTLQGLAHTLNAIDILITPDTGTLHIATSLEIKTVSLFVTRKENGCEPQQDPHLHNVIYASDYNELAFDRTFPKPLEFIPAEIIFKNILSSLSEKNELSAR